MPQPWAEVWGDPAGGKDGTQAFWGALVALLQAASLWNCLEDSFLSENS